MEKKTPAFPRTNIIDRQKERARKVLKLEKESLTLVRGGEARYGLPKTSYCEVNS